MSANGWTLLADLHTPQGKPQAAIVLHHAMMAHRGAMHPLAVALCADGFLVLNVDARGHGASLPLPPAGDWDFDDLVVHDHPAAANFLRELAPELPLWAAGHSLGGQAALAAAALHPGLYSGLIILGSGLWGQESGLLHWRRRLLYEWGMIFVYLFGRLPTGWFGRFRDESAGYWRQTTSWIRHRAWTSRTGLDYHDAVSRLQLPVLAFRGEHDPLVRPEDQRTLVNLSTAHFFTVPGADHARLPRLAIPLLREVLRQEPDRRAPR